MIEASLDSRTALVTGSVAGLGYALAEGLAAAGARVMLNALCPADEGEAAARRLAEASGRETAFSGADLRDPAAIEGMVATATERLGAPDILVNNAVIRHFKPVDAFTVAEWDASIAVNLSAAFHLVRLCVPAMRERGWGRIINLSSIYGARGAENRVDYVTTKTALIGLTRAVAIETARTGITCNAICPGTVPSPPIRERIAGLAAQQGVSVEEAERRYVGERHPTERFVEAENVASLAVFLCGPAGADITGTTLPIDGGWQAR